MTGGYIPVSESDLNVPRVVDILHGFSHSYGLNSSLTATLQVFP